MVLQVSNPQSSNPVTSVVVIHGLRTESRPTTVQNVLSHSRYFPADEVLNVNIFGLIPAINQTDVVILTYDFLALRTWPIWNVLVKRVSSLIDAASIRIAMPQDDYMNCDALDEAVCQLGITHVYTPITKDLHILYPKATAKSVMFYEALTGYVDEASYEKVARFSRPFSDRQIDVGQRIRLLAPNWGSGASLKGETAVAFADLANKAGFKCDVSTKPGDVLLGDDWYKFLGNTRFTVGAKGGVTLADPKGRLNDRVRRILLRRPHLTNDQIRSQLSLRGGRPGDFTAISPRIFESAALGACQILKRDDYFDGFEAWKHYIPIDHTLSIEPKVLEVMKDHARASEIVQESREFLLASKKFTYESFLQQLAKNIGLTETNSQPLVTDSSSELDAAIGLNGEALLWLQAYLGEAIARGSLRQVERALIAGNFMAFADTDEFWATHVDENRESLLAWVDAFRSGRLIVESIAIPWRSASSFLEP